MIYSFRDLLCAQADLATQIFLRQTRREGPKLGGFTSPESGLIDPVGQARDLATCGLALLLPGGRLHGDLLLAEAVGLGIDYLSAVQRPSGRFDLVQTNFDSPPDTAFALGPLLSLLRVAKESHRHEARTIAAELEPMIDRAARGVIDAGFHTPNHRWVIAAALAKAQAFLPDLPCREYVDRLLAEGIDQNADGEYFEKSFAVYHGICDRAFRELARWLDRPELYEPVRKNLGFLAHMLHADGTIVTATSLRQDRGVKAIPVSAADSFFEMGVLDRNDEWLAIADFLIDRGTDNGTPLHPCLMDPFLDESSLRESLSPRGSLPDRYTRLFPAAGLWRHRAGKLSITAAADTTTALGVRYGAVDLQAVKVCASWFGQGQFCPETIREDGGEIVIVDAGERHRLPGYDLPLDRPVSWEDLQAGVDRPRIDLAPLVVKLRIQPIDAGLEVHLVTEGGTDRVPFQVEFCFAPGAELITESHVQMTAADGWVHLRAGFAVVRNGTDAIRISSGNAAHTWSDMRGAEKEPGVFRVLVTFFTPVDHAFRIEAGDWRVGDGCFAD